MRWRHCEWKKGCREPIVGIVLREDRLTAVCAQGWKEWHELFRRLDNSG